MIGLCPLSSGSKGNCIYLGTENCKILIDAGISGRAAKAKLNEIGVDIEDIDAILITHEHGDHIRGAKVISKRHNIPVLANSETAKAIYYNTNEMLDFKIFTTGEDFEFKDLLIHPFSVQHDCADPVGFTIKTEGLKIGICTDLGFASSLIKVYLRECDYLYVEANHQPEMVHASSRPYIYKQRVLSRCGHLSNAACGELIREVYHPNLKHIHLGHLSEECNSPAKALDVIQGILDIQNISVPMSIALQDKISLPIKFEVCLQKN